MKKVSIIKAMYAFIGALLVFYFLMKKDIREALLYAVVIAMAILCYNLLSVKKE